MGGAFTYPELISYFNLIVAILHLQETEVSMTEHCLHQGVEYLAQIMAYS